MKNLFLKLFFVVFLSSSLSFVQIKSRFEVKNAIAFMSNRDRHSEIYVMTPDGKHQERLTESPTASFMPAWSPDRKYIAFVSIIEDKINIFSINMQDRKVTKIASAQGSIYCLSWSYDRKKIAFENDARNGNRRICIIDIGEKTILTLRNNASDPAYSPDGKKIAFRSPAAPNSDIYIMTISTDTIIKVTFTNKESSPAWSPDGHKIAFTSSRSGNADIWIMDHDGNNQKQLTFDLKDDIDPSWSPDGKQIAFSSNRDAMYPYHKFEIYVMNADGSGQTRLTNQPEKNGINAQPSWSQ